MPNWVQNRLTIEGDYEKVLSVLKSKEGDFDFNKIVPMPIELRGSVSGSPSFSKYFYNDDTPKTFTRPELIKYVSKCMRESKYSWSMDRKAKDCAWKTYKLWCKTGFGDWYDWALSNWDTKWNACEVSVADNVVYFQTPWSDVRNLMRKLSKQFPEEYFTYEFAEEQTAYYTGYVEYHNGEGTVIDFVEKSPEAYELFFELWGYDDENYEKLPDGTYKYIGEW